MNDKITFLNKADFSKMVEDTVLQDNIPYIDAIVHLCEKNNIDIQDAQKYVSIQIKKKIEVEAEDLHLLKYKRGRLF